MLDDSYDMEDITTAIIGGCLIGFASTIYFCFFGKSLGISSLFRTVITGSPIVSLVQKRQLDKDFSQAITILCGLVFSSAFTRALNSQHITNFYPFDTTTIMPLLQIYASGFLSGLGSTLTSGCTSGHGLCGLPRFSLRSFVSVILFTFVGGVTATYGFTSYIPAGIGKKELPLINNLSGLNYVYLCLLVPFIKFILSRNKSIRGLIESILLFIIGCFYGAGLMISGLSYPQKVINFLNYGPNWDPSFLIVISVGIFINLIFFNFMIRGNRKPVFSEVCENPKGPITFTLILGSIIFGVGLGLGGICVGPYILFLSLKSIRIPLYWGVSFIFGLITANYVQSKISNQKKKYQ